MKKIIAISSTFNGTKHFVSDYQQRTYDVIITGSTKDPGEAHDFESAAAAKAVMIRINNPFNREYKVEPLTIEVSKHSLQNPERIS